MGKLKVYQMPDGSTWQFIEGTQPEDAVAVEAEKPKTTRRTTSKAKKDE